MSVRVRCGRSRQKFESLADTFINLENQVAAAKIENDVFEHENLDDFPEEHF